MEAGVPKLPEAEKGRVAVLEIALDARHAGRAALRRLI